jgi:hypothetical protein
MRQRLRSHLTYANVMVTLLAFLVLGGGSAYATHLVVNSSDVVDDSLQSVDLKDNAGVKSADVVDDTVTGGGLLSADIRNGEVRTGEVRDGAVRSADVLNDSLTGNDVSESSFGIVPDAAHATNADQLGGRAASGYQRRVTGNCTGPGAIQSIRGDGGVSCSDRAVFPISANLSFNGQGPIRFSPSALGLYVFCGNAGASVEFINHGNGGATLNWLFSQGENHPNSTVNASGTSLSAAGQGNSRLSFVFAKRLEGQWIFADADGVTTVNLHGFFAADPPFCEFKGTAEFAPLG